MSQMLQPYHVPLQIALLKGGLICLTTQACPHLKRGPAQRIQVSHRWKKRVTLIHH